MSVVVISTYNIYKKNVKLIISKGINSIGQRRKIDKSIYQIKSIIKDVKGIGRME